MLAYFLEQQVVIDVLDPMLKPQLERAIGHKEQGLFAIGAGLFFYRIFGSAVDPSVSEAEQQMSRLTRQAELIRAMHPVAPDGKVDTVAAERQLEELKLLTQRFAVVLGQVCTPQELVELSQLANQRVQRALGRA
jgi:hypothetical protein